MSIQRQQLHWVRHDGGLIGMFPCGLHIFIDVHMVEEEPKAQTDLNISTTERSHTSRHQQEWAWEPGLKTSPPSCYVYWTVRFGTAEVDKRFVDLDVAKNAGVTLAKKILQECLIHVDVDGLYA